MNEDQDKKDQQDLKARRIGLAMIAGGTALIGIGAFALHRRKVNNVMKGMQLLLEEETQAAWHDGYDEAIHRFIQGRMAGNLKDLNRLADAYA